MNDTIASKLKFITESPGCYLMKSEGQIIYIGKAKNLKNRVRSYFHSGNHSVKVQTMVNRVDDFDIILCNSNFEALTLECNLIKKHRPFYNILLKDDKQYPFIKIDRKEAFPRMVLARKKDDSGAEFFGPYLSTGVIKEVSNELAKIFPLRNCSLRFPLKEPRRPCVRYEIGLCLAPCANLCTEAEYHEVVNQNIAFLKGNTDLVEKNITAQMHQHAKKLEFEKAAQCRDKLKALQQIKHKQVTVTNSKITQDVWAVASNTSDAFVYKISIVEGKILSGTPYLIRDGGGETHTDILSAFLPQAYDEEQNIPKEVLLSTDTDDNASLEQWLRTRADKAVRISVPQRGQKRLLIETCEKNAKDALAKHALMEKLHNAKTIGAVHSLTDILGLKQAPRRIEGFDISNTQGTYSVASMVVFIDGKPSKKAYRRFKIKSVEGADDFASIEEVVYRRFRHGLEERAERSEKGLPYNEGSFSDFPDLILIDGGPQQLRSAMNALYALGLQVNLFGLAERNEEVYIPNRTEPIVIDGHDPALHLIQRIRDESHRFAITYHRSLRDKAMVKSSLLSIPGVGRVRYQALMKHFKSLQNMQAAELSELEQVKNITPAIAQDIYHFFHGKSYAEEA